MCLLYKRFKFKWIEGNGRSTIKIDKLNKWRTYLELNRAAEFLYNHRIGIRQIKCEVCEEIRRNRITDKTIDVAKFFSERANKLFDKILIE